MPESVLDKKILTRSISLPVQQCLSHPWRELERLVCDCWHHSTCLANWAAHTLRSRDAVRAPGMANLPPLEKIDLYALAFGRERESQGRQLYQCPECARKWHLSQTDEGLAPEHERGTGKRKVPCPGAGKMVVTLGRAVLPAVPSCYEGADFWEGAKVAAVSVLRKVAMKYARERGKIIWRRERRTPEYLYPHPYPVHQQQWVPSIVDQGRPVIHMALPGGRVALRLRNGPEFPHAMRVFRQLVEGELAQRELTLDSQSSRAHCRLVHAQRPGDEPARELRLMVRIAYQMEVAADFGTGQTAILRTGREPFLTMETPAAARPFILHAPWVQQWIAGHRRFLDRFADDMKFEKRWPRKARKRRNRRQSRGCDLHANRMTSFRQQTARQFVAHAKRRGCDRIVYDDSDKSFADEFPWFLFAQELQSKCDEMGLALTLAASAEVMNGEERGSSQANPD